MEDRYARQSKLKEMTEPRAAAVRDACVVVIGAGGVGSSCLEFLAGSGIRQLVICDFDDVSLTNLHRQIIHSEN